LPGPVLIVTPLAVLRKDDDAPFRIESCHPGVDPETVFERTGFSLDRQFDGRETARPADEELRILRTEIDPSGTSTLEFLRGDERLARIRSILEAERTGARARLAARPAQALNGHPHWPLKPVDKRPDQQ
jgi:hypothetical protein